MPNYTLHMVLAGLRDAYRFAGNQQALEIERRMADYLAGVYDKLAPAQAQEILKAEFGGMNEVFADLAEDTGDSRYLEFAGTIFHHDFVLDPLERGEDRLNGQHGNTQIPKIVGLAREYELAGKPEDLTAVRVFWDSVVKPQELTFMPLHRVYEEHYAVYFPLLAPSEWKSREGEILSGGAKRAKLDAATVDSVQPGFQQSEVEHRFLSANRSSTAKAGPDSSKRRPVFPSLSFPCSRPMVPPTRSTSASANMNPYSLGAAPLAIGFHEFRFRFESELPIGPSLCKHPKPPSKCPPEIRNPSGPAGCPDSVS